MIRVLFPLHGFVEWNGGLDLVRLIVAGLTHRSLQKRVELSFAMPETGLTRKTLRVVLRRWHVIQVGKRVDQADSGSDSALRRIAATIVANRTRIPCKGSVEILNSATELKSDIVFPTMLPLGRSRTIPRVAYIFDFQHRHMPHLFPARTLRNRDARFARLAADADGILVNSLAAKKDVTDFLGVARDRILAMPFSPYVESGSLNSDPEGVKRKYNINAEYLIICNHFWVHKDHATALRAFALLKQRGRLKQMQLVLTGDPVDHRDPHHYARLIRLAEQLSIAGDIHFLGLIPKQDQLALIRGCRALLQPTLFEGGPGGGSVYAAIGLGVPTVVSDIPINREIDGGRVAFFKAEDAEDLARKTLEILTLPTLPQTPQDLLIASDARLARLGGVIADFLERFASIRHG